MVTKNYNDQNIKLSEKLLYLVTKYKWSLNINISDDYVCGKKLKK